MCQQVKITYECGCEPVAVRKCPDATRNNIEVEACPDFIQEPDMQTKGKCGSCEVQLVNQRQRDLVILKLEGFSRDGNSLQPFPEIIPRRPKGKGVARMNSIREGKGVARMNSIREEAEGNDETSTQPPTPGGSTPVDRPSTSGSQPPAPGDATRFDRPSSSRSQRQRPVAEPRKTPLKNPEPRVSLTRTLSEKMKGLMNKFPKD